MSTVVRGPDGKIKLFCKGADTVILERLSEHQPYTEKTLVHLEVSSTSLFPLKHATNPFSSRNMPPTDCVHCVSLSVMFPNRNIDNGWPYIIRPRRRSTGAAKSWTRRQSSLKRICSYSVLRLLRTSFKKAYLIPFTRFRLPESRSIISRHS